MNVNLISYQKHTLVKFYSENPLQPLLKLK